jgi:hypothetical protein
MSPEARTRNAPNAEQRRKAKVVGGRKKPTIPVTEFVIISLRPFIRDPEIKKIERRKEGEFTITRNRCHVMKSCHHRIGGL